MYETSKPVDRRGKNAGHILLGFISGEFNFIEDSVRLLKIHSFGEKATFGYQFMPFVLPVKQHSIFDIPEEFWTSSTHLDEIPFVLGYPKMTDHMLKPYSGMMNKVFTIKSAVTKRECLLVFAC